MAGRGKSVDGIRNLFTEVGFQFFVGRIARFFQAGKYVERVGGAPVYLYTVLEYLVVGVFDWAGNATRDNKKTRIVSRHILLVVRKNEELSKFLGMVTIANGVCCPLFTMFCYGRRPVVVRLGPVNQRL